MNRVLNNEVTLVLHELIHMNLRARARHRVAAASQVGEQRHAHEMAAHRHGVHAEQLSDRLDELGGGAAVASPRMDMADVHNGRDARTAIQAGRGRLIERYEQALREVDDRQTFTIIFEQCQAIRAEVACLSPGLSPAVA